jgi:hypothetical protein
MSTSVNISKKHHDNDRCNFMEQLPLGKLKVNIFKFIRKIVV